MSSAFDYSAEAAASSGTTQIGAPLEETSSSVEQRETGAHRAIAPLPLQLSVVIPTLNERENVDLLIDRIEHALHGLAWEAIFVDDNSPDGTADRVKRTASRDMRVRCLKRVGRRGLSSACIEGVLASAAPCVVVMDADLQHDETLIPAMFHVLERDNADIVVASRYMDGSSCDDWDKCRRSISDFATRLGQLVIGTKLTDPMSGFFMVPRDIFESAVPGLSGVGFKILLDLLATRPGMLRIAELPYTFRARHAGSSKLDSAVAWQFGYLLLDKTIGKWVPVRFVVFSAVGALGLAVHLAVLALMVEVLQADFVIGQGLATFVAMTNNFILNNVLTYRDQRLRGWALLRGFMSFFAACGFGAAANIGVAAYAYGAHDVWWFAGTAGALVGAVWNYAVTSYYTWRQPT